MFTQCLIVVVVILLVLVRWKPNKFVKLHEKLGNDFMYFPIIGNAFSFAGNNEDRMTTLIKATLQCYKREHNAISLWLGPMFIVILSSTDLAYVVLKSALNKNFIHKFAKDLTGNGTVFASAHIWHRRRKILVPSFAPRYVKQFIAVFEAQNKTLVENFKSHVGKGNFACWDAVYSYALDSVCETMFGMNVDLQRQPDHPFFKAFDEFVRNGVSRIFQPWYYSDSFYKLMPVFRRQEQMKKIIHAFLDDIICTKKKQIEEKGGNESETKNPRNTKLNFKTFLELMIENSKDDAYTLEELREETIVQLVAASDTTAAWICTTLLLFCKHTDVQERVYREIIDVIGDSNNPLTSKDLLKLKYTRAVINESLRLYPPVPFINRYCTEDLELPSGITLPKGTNAVINIWGIQHNPLYWGEDANVFNPDRFMSKQIPKAFIPFSYGIRNCIGRQYGMLSLTTVLVSLLRQYRFTPATGFTFDENNPLRLSFDLISKHIDRYPIQIEYRKLRDINEVAK
ncbi:cytochrome P450 4V2-like [Vanessa cardui]|uniref:cytochrome P450 4V2-like n=1 Tax=Vanessa cardui TaxID=171605 RepID=UPI001F12BDCC|nr:cytochrome P450 4V2-like [Vanessa cardui]